MLLSALPRVLTGASSRLVVPPRKQPTSIGRAMSAPAKPRLPTHLLNSASTRVSVLKNGMRVATEHVHGQTATVGVWIDAGSAHESKAKNGAAHFLEHMAFKGTTTRSRVQIEKTVEDMGAQLNAYTSREQTVYWARAFKQDVPKAVAILGDILQNSKLTEDDIEAERSVILREMQEVDSMPEEVIMDHLHSVAFQGTSHGYTILGPEENIRSLQRRDLADYIYYHYTGPNMILVATGDVAHNEMVQLAEQTFGKLPNHKKQPMAPPAYTGSGVNVRNDEMPAAHVAYAFEGVGWTDPDYFVFLVMQALIGSWDRNSGAGANLISRLAERVSLENLGHSLMAFNTPYKDTGLFGVYGTAPSDTLEDFSYEIFAEFRRLSMTVTESEVTRAKNKVKASLLLGADGTTAIAEDVGRQLLTIERRMPVAEVFLRIDDVRACDVMRVAKQRMFDVDHCVAALGPTVNLPDYNLQRDWLAQRLR